MSVDVLLQHAAESWPQVVKSPVECVDAVTQNMAAKWTHLEKEHLLLICYRQMYAPDICIVQE